MRIDLVIPAHNEERRIDRTLRAYRAQVSDPSTRILVALDCCTDGTAEVVDAHAQIDSRIEVCRYPKLGKGGVLMESFRKCDADLIGFVDADCATPPAEFLRLADLACRADGAIATRSHPAAVLPVQRSIGRRIDSWVFSALMRALFRMPFSDTQCGAKVLRRSVVQDVVPLLSSRDFLFDVDLLVTASRLGYRILEVPTVWCDQAGSHISATGDARRMVVSSLRLWLHQQVLPLPSPAASSPPSVIGIDSQIRQPAA
jgi:glycosyltransferase involved in cell wall biosynthesis